MFKWSGHVLALAGSALVLYGVFFEPWMVVHPAGGVLGGTDLDPGRAASVVALLCLAATLGGLFFRRSAWVAWQAVSGVMLLACAAWAWLGAPAEIGLPEGWSLEFKTGFLLLQAGASMVLVGALHVIASAPPMTKGMAPLRVAVLWNGTVLRERVLLEPGDVTIGTGHEADFTVPEECGLGRKEVLLKAGRTGRYTLNLLDGLSGKLKLDGQEGSAALHRKDQGDEVTLGKEDWGLLHAGPMAVFFQHTTPESVPRTAAWARVDSNTLATGAASALVHLSLILAALFLWNEADTVKRNPLMFRHMDVQATYMLEQLEEEVKPDEEDGLDKELESQAAAGKEGAFGEPDLKTITKVPRNEVVRTYRKKVDPKNVGLTGVLSTTRFRGHTALATILSRDRGGMDNKLAVAMRGADGELAMGNGNRGLGFKGLGEGGDGTCTGEGCGIHALGDMDKLTSGTPGTRLKTEGGRKPKRKVDKFSFGRGQTTQGCKAGDIKRAVRRRASSIRYCLEGRLAAGSSGTSGRLTVRWTIGMNGRVTAANVMSSTVGDGALKACVLRVVRRMSFPKPEGATCVVKWPFVFNS